MYALPKSSTVLHVCTTYLKEIMLCVVTFLLSIYKTTKLRHVAEFTHFPCSMLFHGKWTISIHSSHHSHFLPPPFFFFCCYKQLLSEHLDSPPCMYKQDFFCKYIHVGMWLRGGWTLFPDQETLFPDLPEPPVAEAHSLTTGPPGKPLLDAYLYPVCS